MDRTIHSLEVRRDDLRTTRIAAAHVPVLGEGQMLLRVDRFGLTANNVTYGVVADLIGYWGFFPADEGWGRIPVWGYADVVAGGTEEVPNGTRVFGFLPMSTHLIVQPHRVTPRGFVDGAGHRSGVPPVYNHYQRTDADPMYTPEAESLHAIFYPLFATSFVIDDFLADNDDFGADRIVLSSASSKTALGTALSIAKREGGRPQVVGLTSARNVEFVVSVGCYDEVIAYEDVASLDLAMATVYVDFAGNAGLRRSVHERLATSLAASFRVGVTHWDAGNVEAELPGPTPEMFFAPAQIDKRMKEWGMAGYQQRLGTALRKLMDDIARSVDVVEINSLEGLESAYLQMLDGHFRPDEALAVVLSAR